MQPYWTNDKPTSSFGKALQTAHSLKELIEARTMTSTRTSGEDRRAEHTRLEDDDKDEEGRGGGERAAAAAASAVLSLKSCHHESQGAEPVCTNWTEDFLG